MASQAQKHFYTLLLGRELVREALSDVYEATAFQTDDRDVSDGNFWNVDDSLMGMLRNHFQASNTARGYWKISPEDMYSLSHLLFWSEVPSRKWLYERLESADMESSGLVFQILSKFVEKNVRIPDENFPIFISSQTKEEMELILSPGIARIFQSLEAAIRENIGSHRDIMEKILRKPDFLDEAELEELRFSLETFVGKITSDIEQLPEVTALEGKFENFWGKIVR